MEGQVSVPFEIVDDYDCHPIIEKNKKKLISMLMQSPPAREVLRVKSNDISDSILPSICSIQLDECKDEELLKGVTM